MTTIRRTAWIWILMGVFVLATSPAWAKEKTSTAVCNKSFADIYEQLAPAIVSITSASVNPYEVDTRVIRSVGSGVLIAPSGSVLTNAHLVLGQQVLTVTLRDNLSLEAQVVGLDPIFDVALLHIPQPAKLKLPTAKLGDSTKVRVGDEVITIGNPLGLNQSLTQGTVSGINRVLPELPLSVQAPLIQTDAPINPGNSGGPLVNRCGDIIGITTLILSSTQNIGFVIPSNLIRSVLPALIKDGEVIRPWLGFRGKLVDPILIALLRLPLVEGFLVEMIDPDSPAEHAGLQGGQHEIIIDGKGFLIGGDIITKVNEQAITSSEHLSQVLKPLKVGQTLHLTVFRNGEERVIDYLLPKRPLLPWDVPRTGS